MGLRKVSLIAVLWFALFVGSNAEEQESEQERRPIKTFKTIYGEIIDCIDIYKQPAFDHPLLKDHKLQRKPSFSLSATKHKERAQVKQLEISLPMDGCPDGTIPILRTTEEDRMRAKSLEQTRPQIYQPLDSQYPGFQFAVVELPSYGQAYFGAQGFLDHYIPECQLGQYSGAQIWLINNNDMIQAGWRVEPDLYNDDRSHFFVYWQGNGRGCYNLQCSGFVQVDKSIAVGQILLNSSVYEGIQYEIQLTINQDPGTKNWWLVLKNSINVGYWPANLFPQLASGAQTIQYGGVAHTSQGLPYPPMGSGYFPDHSFSHACYVRQIHFQNGSQWLVPERWRGHLSATSKDCYNVATNNKDKFMGYTLLFGGPGGANCGS